VSGERWVNWRPIFTAYCSLNNQLLYANKHSGQKSFIRKL
jgi:hypothetical protein